MELIVGHDVRGRDRLLSSYRSALLVACGLGVAFTLGLGAWVARSALAPVRRLSREAGAITPDALSIRLSVEGAATELQQLVDGFNRALDRVQMAYDQLRAFRASTSRRNCCPAFSTGSSAPTPRDGRMPNTTDSVWRSCARWPGCTAATPLR